MNRTLWLLALALCACLPDALADAPCNTDADCLGDYRCAFTPSTNQLGDAGRCRRDGRCAPGRQNGCAAAAGRCEGEDVTVACDEDTDACFCCDLDRYGLDNDDAPFAVAVRDVVDDGSSAECVVCDSGSCDDPLEACVRGWDRCVFHQEEDTCGCRLPVDRIENSACNADDDCGESLSCERTLEQAEEPAESLAANQVQEEGACRPDGDPACDPGQQNGCRIDIDVDNSAYRCARGSGLVEVHDEDGQGFCCREQSQADGFVLLVYAVTPTGTDAACTECPTACAEGEACTAASHRDCVIGAKAPCGCT